MPYFPVDDGFHSHRKAIKAGLAAIGLWAMAGSWSNKEGTDGFVPDYIVSRFSSDYESLAAKLVEVRLWEVDEVDGEKGWRFHDWTGAEDGVRRNYTRDETVQKRRQWADRQAKRRGKPNDIENVTRDNTRDSRSDSHGESRVQNTPMSRGRHGVPVPVPVPALPIPNPVVQVQNQGGVDLSALPDEKFPDTMSEEDKPAAMRSPLTTVRCPDHQQCKIGNCFVCKTEHGNPRWFADPSHWREGDRRHPDYARLKAWTDRA